MNKIKNVLANSNIKLLDYSQEGNVLCCEFDYSTLNSAFFDVVKELGYYVSFIVCENNKIRFDLCRLVPQ